jgi:RNA ligase
MFPQIKTIDDVLPHIAGNENFSVNRKDDYIVIDYILNTPDLFHNPVEKECRGIIFDAETGKLLRRPLHKFFNLNERPESSSENIDFSQPHSILEKLDGSMIVPFFRPSGGLIWGSKAGETFLTPQVEEFVNAHPEYDEFARMAIETSYTPIFEWCTRKNRIVIDHIEDRLVLIAVRDNAFDGNYGTYDELKRFSRQYNIEVVPRLERPFETLEALATMTKGLEGMEGFVVAFDDGLRIKIKADQYVLHHKAKDTFNLEKNVLAIIFNSQGDDFRQLLAPLDRERFMRFENDVDKYIHLVARNEHMKIIEYMDMGMTKKHYALGYQRYCHPRLRSIYFKYLEGEYHPMITDVLKDLINILKKHCTSQADVDSIRPLFGNYSWYDYS